MPDLPTSTQVVIVGAGLAGLAAAKRLIAAGLEVIVAESGSTVGGRVGTDRVDGMLLDRGFQQFNRAYPAAEIFDIEALDLRPFRAGLIVTLGEHRYRFGDPRRWPAAALPSLRAPVGSIFQKLRLLRWVAEINARSEQRLLEAPDRSLAQELTRRGLDGRLGRTVIRPFLAGILGEESMTTSNRFASMIIRSLARGTPALPTHGMQALPDQLARGLGADVLYLNTTVFEVGEGVVKTDRGTVRAAAVVVAADPRSGCQLVGLPTPQMRGLTTFYHVASEPPTRERALHIDGERRGPVVNSAVVSNAAPSYSRRGALIATTVLGSDDSSDMESLAREQAGMMYGTDARGWEHVATYAIRDALPALVAPLPLARTVQLGAGVYIAGDHRDTASIQGALNSGHRVATAVLAQLGAAATAPADAAGPGSAANDRIGRRAHTSLRRTNGRTDGRTRSNGLR